jgi:hypothetical protein
MTVTINTVTQSIEAQVTQAGLIGKLMAVPGVSLVHDEILCSTPEAAEAVSAILMETQP